MIRRAIWLPAVAALALAAGCGEDDTANATVESASAPSAATATATATATVTATATAAKPAAAPARKRAGTKIQVAGSQFGDMLYDSPRKQAIYLFDKETSKRSECYGACAKAWPPVLTKGRPRAVKGTRSSLLGTTRRRDGKLQVTYKGHPLYYYAHEGPGQVLCHNVREFGGLWLVVKPNGNAAPH